MPNYTDQQIRDFVQAQGVADDPYAISNYARQFGVNDAQVGSALGYTDDQVKGFRGNVWGYQDRVNGQGTADDVQRTMGGGVDFGANTPHKAFAAAQLNHWTPQQADQALGLGAGTSANWAKQQGLQWGDWSGNSPAPTRFSQMMGQQSAGVARPRSSWGGGADSWDGGGSPSTYGATPGALPGSTGAGGWSSITGQGGPNGGPNYMPGPGGMRPGGMGTPSSYDGSGINPGADSGNTGMMPGGWNGGGWGGMSPWGFTSNPGTAMMAGTLTQNAMDTLQRGVLPGIRQGAMSSGGVGSSRQGIAEGLATGETMKGLSGALAGLYSGQYNQDRNYGLQSDSLDWNIYQGNNAMQRQAQQDQLGLADRMLGWNQQYGIGNANNVQNTPLNYWQQFGNMATQFGGMGGTQSQNLQGNPWLGGLGGAMSGYNLYNQYNNNRG